MNIKNVFVAIFSLVLLVTLTSCNANESNSVTEESTTILNAVTNETEVVNNLNTETTILNTTEYYVEETGQSVSGQTTSPEIEVTTSTVYDDPANWSKERIIEEYKNAARKSSTTAKSQQKIVMKDISVNGGENAKMMSFIKSIITKFLESSSTEINGITGGYENLVLDDVSSAKAYKNDTGTVVEMFITEQTSGAKEDSNTGSVSHAISTIGDISTVVSDLNDRGLSIKLSENEEDTKIYYTNPTINIVVNENGEIVEGIWKCTVTISMDNLKAFGKDVENATIVMENTITL